METDSDGDGTLEPEYAPMGMPSLVKQLRGILSEYPDGGQIIKELIQNAEDAEAGEIKLLFDNRRINRHDGGRDRFRRFFQAPALCVYNDAMFSEEDWRGIQMVYSSVKEGDRLKVGRFGLGFKSVFHITDYPCVISGDRVLLIDHQQSPYKVNATLRLNKLSQYKGMDTDAFLEAFDQTFEFCSNTLTNGFNGTILWFPLREVPSALSDTIYTADKINNLFDAIKSEASSILIFLKNITRLSWYLRACTPSQEIGGKTPCLEEIGRAEIIGNVDEVSSERKTFQNNVKEVDRDFSGKSMHNSFILTVQTSFRHQVPELTQWLVVNYFMGGEASPEFRKLIMDEGIGYCPYVGLAAPMGSCKDKFAGRVFCFLPLPKEGVSGSTGLPVHVNGFFAMSQNRHHMKWATEEQDITKVDDKSILWNEKLITECLPPAYEILLKTAIKYSTNEGNTTDTIAAVYSAIPDKREALDKWKETASATIERMSSHPLLYTQKLTCALGKWIPVRDAHFATLENLPKQSKEAVIKVLCLIQENYVNISREMFDKLNAAFNNMPQDMTPKALRLLMKQSERYHSMSLDEKLFILAYLLSDDVYDGMDGIQLLPLASGKWGTFSSHADEVFLCKEEEIPLFPGFADHILAPLAALPKNVADHLKEIAKQECFQLRKLTTEAAKDMISVAIQNAFTDGELMYIRPSEDVPVSWLERVWNYIIDHRVTEAYRDVPIMPLLLDGDWHCPGSVQLVCLNDTLILQKLEDICLPFAVASSLELLGVKVVPELPPWIPLKYVNEYILTPECSSVLKLISKRVQSKGGSDVLEGFNTSLSPENRDDLLKYFCNITAVDKSAKESLRMLKLFKEGWSASSEMKYVSINENGNFITDCTFPITFPKPLVILSKEFEGLVKQLGAKEIEYNALILQTLHLIIRPGYCEEEVQKFMKYFIENFSKFEEHKDIMDAAKLVAFLDTSFGLRCPSELFNPTDESLRDLFEGEVRFPNLPNINGKTLYALKALGLREAKDLTEEVLFETASILDSRSEMDSTGAALDKKARAFLQVISKNEAGINLKQFAGRIHNFCCIKCTTERDGNFPDYLPWFNQSFGLYKPAEVRHLNQMRLVGSTMPLVAAEKNISDVFQWNTDPPLPKVLEQLASLKDNYETQRKPDILPVVKVVYQYLSRHLDDLKANKVGDVVWTGDGFTSPTNVVLKSMDLDLKPYFFYIPDEFLCFQELFEEIGCTVQVTVDVCIETLCCMNESRTVSGIEKDENNKWNQVVKILQALSSKDFIISGKENEILVPIQTENEESFAMKPLSQCTYDEHPFAIESDEDGDKEYFVHEKIPVSIVKGLGIKSTSKRALSDMDDYGVEVWGQDEPLTTRLKSLLDDGYTDGLSVPKELIQNADDAGASVVKILYDERENSEHLDNLLSPGMRDCQGPALWVFNDAVFTDQDLENITKLNGHTKENDARKIGKFGLGFCSVYNLTDVPSFISKSNLVVFDPHGTHLEEALPGRRPGLKIDFSKRRNQALVRRKRNQFAPYQNVFDCDIHGLNSFNGTLFRFPLRTFVQAQRSKISQICYSRQEVQKLLALFMATAGDMFLFTQSVKSLEIFHLTSEQVPQEKIIMFSLTKQSYCVLNNELQPLEDSVLVKMSKAKVYNFAEIQKNDIKIELLEEARRFIPELSIAPLVETSWLCSWASNSESSDIKTVMAEDGAHPIAAVAMPLLCGSTVMPTALKDIQFGFSSNGGIFCFLPLPLRTGLQLHINGCFDVTPDRRQLVRVTDDDKGTDREIWNRNLMEDALVSSFIGLLLLLSKTVNDERYLYHSLWPVGSDNNDVIKPFKDSFYKHVINTDKKVFKSTRQTWVSFKELVFLDPMLRENRTIEEISKEILTYFPSRANKTFVDMPSNVFEVMTQTLSRADFQKVESVVIRKEELLKIFLKHLDDMFWKSRIDKRDRMIMYTLRSDAHSIQTILKETKCVPTEPRSELQKPSHLIHPSEEISKLYREADGRFPSKQLAFRDPNVLEKLTQLGMITKELPGDMLIERCRTVDSIAMECCTCAYERSQYILHYLIAHRYNLPTNAEEIKEMHIIPVMCRPDTWAFSWKAESSDVLKRYNSHCGEKHSLKETSEIVLGQSSNLYSKKVYKFIGSVENVMNAEFDLLCQGNNMFGILGVKGIKPMDIDVQLLVDQIIVCVHEFYCEEQFENVSHILKRLSHILNEKLHYPSIAARSITETCLKRLCNLPVVVCGNKLVVPANVAFHVKEECVPYLHRIDPNEQSKREYYRCIGVQEMFSPEVIVDSLRKIKELPQPLSSDSIKINNDLLVDLEESLAHFHQKYDDLKDVHNDIVAPDIHGYVYAIHELVIDDEEFETSDTMHILHGRIPPALAKLFGAKSKQRHSFSEMSCGLPFGQKEELVTRISGLLKSYPCDAGIMKELVQNADDAGATEIHFIKDFRRDHSKKKIFGETCSHLQEPALCVFNDSFFNEEDFKGIQNLGIGSKSDNPTKTGQYGVGFNAVYHLTDLPSFVTVGPGIDGNGALCILDPLCEYIPGVQKSTPGVKCCIEEVQKRFPDALSGFLLSENIWSNKKGTLFRLPLRSKPSELKQDVVSDKDIDDMLSEMREEMFVALLFVKNVNTIRVSSTCTDGLKEEYAVQIKISESEKQKREQFFEAVNNVVASAKQQREKYVLQEPFEVGYEMTVEDTSMKRKNWYIVQRFGLDHSQETPSVVTKAYQRQQLGMLPIGGIAIPQVDVADMKPSVDATLTTDYFRAFCFLPLPLKTGLPVHLNGHFALDHESRRDLWNDGDRKIWNECVIKQIIVPAYVSALKFIGLKYSESATEIGSQQRNLLDLYHEAMPTYKDADGSYWKLLITHLYSRITSERLQLFPVLYNSEALGANVSKCEWVPIAQEFRFDHGVFEEIAVVYKQSTDFSEKEKESIVTVFKNIGLKVINTPIRVYHAMRDCGLEGIPTTTPDNVVIFMKELKNNFTEFSDLEEYGKPIIETKIGDIDSLRCLIKFMSLGPQFATQIQSLPILLTNDSFIKFFKIELPMFITRFCDLLPQSPFKFVHRKLLDLYPEEVLHNSKVCVSFGIREFESLLGYSLNAADFKAKKCIEWDISEKCETMPNITWVRDVWDFILESSEYHIVDKEQGVRFQNTLTVLSNWSLLPSIVDDGHKRCHRLIPMSEVFTLIDVESFSTNRNLYQVIKELKPPQLDDEIFKKLKCVQAIRSCSSMATYHKPVELLKWLHYHRTKIGKSGITNSAATALLKYLSSNIDMLSESCDSLQTKLSALPLYITLQNKRIKLGRGRKAIILPRSIPADGMEDLAESISSVFLKDYVELHALFKYLSMQPISPEEFYATIVLPNIRHLDRNCWQKHIQYIRDNLLGKHFTRGYSFHQQTIIALLRGIPFITVNGRMKLCSELFDHRCRLFQVMRDLNSFPSKEFRDHDWCMFLAILGMPTEVTDNLLLQFAREIAAEGYQCISERLKTQSNAVRQHFVSNISSWKSETVREIGQLKFILPFCVPSRYSNIYKQNMAPDCFVRFCDCLHNKHLQICWSTADLLRQEENSIPEKCTLMLGMKRMPEMKQVTQHAQNISTELHTQVEKGAVQRNVVQEVMTSVYTFLQKSDLVDQDVSRRLESFPIIYMNEIHKMVTVKDVVIQITDTEMVEPYLFRAPVQFGPYFDLFTKLGVSKNVQCFHYMKILETLHRLSDNTPLFELDIVQKAIQNLVRLLDGMETPYDDNIPLYLPNSEKVMAKAQLLTISTNWTMRERLSSLQCIEYFLGFTSLEIKLPPGPMHFLNKIPEKWRPRLLRNDTKEIVSMEDVKIVEDSARAQQLEDFLHSPYFLQGICRILIHQLIENKKEFDAKIITENINQQLLKTSVLEVTGLKTYLLYCGQRVLGSDRAKHFHQEMKIEEGQNTTYLYFASSDGSFEDNQLVHNLSSFISSLVPIRLKDQSFLYLSTVLGSMNRPENIPNALDVLNVSPLGFEIRTNTSIFPRPGTYVEKHFYPFLEQTMTLFEKYEYKSLALELEDREMDDDSFASSSCNRGTGRGEPVYIYVHIIRNLTPANSPHSASVILTKYLVDTGADDHEYSEIPAYRLYRFVRKPKDTGSDIVLHDTEAVGTIPFDENCRRVRLMLIEAWTLVLKERKKILKRLLLKWHPDRNRGANEEYATRIFNYIKTVMCQLEAQEHVDDSVDDQTGRAAPNLSGSLFQGMVERVDKRAPVIEAAYRGSLENYRRSRIRHIRAERVKRPDMDEAIRWLRQAKLDYRAAEQFLSSAADVEGYNWICYTCHQACEKAMKAVIYTKDANDRLLQRKGHSLWSLGYSLSPEILQLATSLTQRLQEHNRMRYPSPINRPAIPSDLYNEDDAKFALEVAQKIIELAEERVQ